MKDKIILSGIQPTGSIHIGNYFGAIKPLFSLQQENKAILFIADIHSMTTITNPEQRRNNTYHMLSALIALGYDFKRDILFKQSDVPEVTELAFYFNCLTPFNTLKKAHAFLDKMEEPNVNCGLFTYPTLMSADILLYNSDIVPVGKDQLQHLEITRTLTNKFNSLYGKTFNIPEPYIIEKNSSIIGTDGRKMSKSYNNTIEIFAKEEDLKKTIDKIPTNSIGANEPKDYENCNLFKIFSLFSFSSEIEEMKEKYNQGITYSSIKKIIFELILDYFSEERNTYNGIINKKDFLNSVLISGKLKAREIAIPKMEEIKTKLGFK